MTSTSAAELLTDNPSSTARCFRRRARRASWRALRGWARSCAAPRFHRQWENGGELCTFYDFKVETPAGAGSIPMAEWNSFRDGKLASARLIFDTAAMAALMPGS